MHRILFGLALMALSINIAHAQTTQAEVKIDYVLPTQGCAVGATVCNQPLTGTAAITKCGFWLSTSSIPTTIINTSTGATTVTPTAEVGPTATTTTQTITATPGGKVYIRVACADISGYGRPANEVTKDVPIPPDVFPDVPTSVTVTITLK
jgi:hypothetical protein